MKIYKFLKNLRKKIRKTLSFSKIQFSDQNGFSILEVIISMTVMSIISVSIMNFTKFFYHYQCREKTNKNKEIIVNALSAYLFYCKMIPNPSEMSDKPTGKSSIGCICGVVPFKTLGISEEYAKDGYGRYFVYIINPLFSKNRKQHEASNGTILVTIAGVHDSFYQKEGQKNTTIIFDSNKSFLMDDYISKEKNLLLKKNHDSINEIDDIDEEDFHKFQNSYFNTVLFVIISHNESVKINNEQMPIETKTLKTLEEKIHHNLSVIFNKKFQIGADCQRQIYEVMHTKRMNVWWYSVCHFSKMSGVNLHISNFNSNKTSEKVQKFQSENRNRKFSSLGGNSSEN